MHTLNRSQKLVSTKSVKNTHNYARLRELHGALLEIISVMNRPQRDDAMIAAAGISLDRALFPLLVLVERFGPIGVVDLADRVGRDHTTVSRQIAKMEGLSLVHRTESAHDRRVRVAVVSDNGRQMIEHIDAARKKMGEAIFADWSEQEVDDLVRLMSKFAEAIKQDPLESLP